MIEPTHWALACAILVAAIIEAEITRRSLTGRDKPEPRTATVSPWALAGAIAVPLALAVALVLVLCAYRDLRRKRVDVFACGVAACAVVAAHFAAWTTPSQRPDTAGMLAVAAAAAACLVIGYLASFLRYRKGMADLGLDAALLATGAIVGALAPGGLLVVFVGIPVVVMVHHATFTQRLEDEASVDQKTGLATAACWQAHAGRAFAEAAPDRQPIGVLMVDLDHFKRLNDTYGHRAGDDVLAAVGACLRSQLRESDLAGRFGGEEFTVLLPGAGVSDTMNTAERIRAAISELRVTTVDKHCRHTVITDVTASVGVAVHPSDGTTRDECLRVADSHAYQAKQQGRNTVVGDGTESHAPFIPNQREG